MSGLKAPAGDYSSQYWFLRMDDVSGVDTTVLTSSKDWGVVYLVKENDGEPNPHYHVFLKYKSTRTKSTMCKYLKGLFPMLSGNGDFSYLGNPTMSEDDKNRILRYMSKGKNHGYTLSNPQVIFKTAPVNVEFQHNEYWRIFKGLSGGKSKSKEGVSDRYIREVKELVIKRTIRKPTFGDLTDLLLEVSKGRLNDHSAFAVIQALQYHYEPGETETNFRHRMWSKFNPDRYQ